MGLGGTVSGGKEAPSGLCYSSVQVESWERSLGREQSGLGLLPLPSLPSVPSTSAHLPHPCPLVGTIQPGGSTHGSAVSVPGGNPVDKVPEEATQPVTRFLYISHLSVTSVTPHPQEMGALVWIPVSPDLTSLSLGQEWRVGWREATEEGEAVLWTWEAVESIPILGQRQSWGPTPRGSKLPVGGVVQAEGSQGEGAACVRGCRGFLAPPTPSSFNSLPVLFKNLG